MDLAIDHGGSFHSHVRLLEGTSPFVLPLWDTCSFRVSLFWRIHGGSIANVDLAVFVPQRRQIDPIVVCSKTPKL